MRTSRRKMYGAAMSQPQPSYRQQPGAPTRNLLSRPPNMLQVQYWDNTLTGYKGQRSKVKIWLILNLFGKRTKKVKCWRHTIQAKSNNNKKTIKAMKAKKWKVIIFQFQWRIEEIKKEYSQRMYIKKMENTKWFGHS